MTPCVGAGDGIVHRIVDTPLYSAVDSWQVEVARREALEQEVTASHFPSALLWRPLSTIALTSTLGTHQALLWRLWSAIHLPCVSPPPAVGSAAAAEPGPDQSATRAWGGLASRCRRRASTDPGNGDYPGCWVLDCLANISRSGRRLAPMDSKQGTALAAALMPAYGDDRRAMIGGR